MKKLNLTSGHFLANPKILTFGLLMIAFIGLSVFQYSTVVAQIENVLMVQPTNIDLGVALPGQGKGGSVLILLSEAALQNSDLGTVSYSIIQKQKCKTFSGDGGCVEYYPNLCPYLAEIPQTVSSPEAPEDENIIGTPHETKPYPVAEGTLGKNYEVMLDESPSLFYYRDVADKWGVELRPPCFEDFCGDAILNGAPLPVALKGQTFGCDLWVEVAGIIQPTIAQVFNNFPFKTAQAFEAHIIEVTATLAGDSPAQFAAEPSVRMALPQAKVVAKAISEFYHNSEDSFSIYTGGKYAKCLFFVEPDAIVLCLAGVFANSRIDEFLIFTVDSLANDPPRQDFDIVAKIKPIKPIKPFDNSPLRKASAKYETATARQAQIRDAIVTTFERIQGAIIADEGQYMLLQSKTLAELFERLADNQENLRASIELLIRKLDSSWNEELEQKVLQLAMNGFSAEERQLLEQAGLTKEEITTLQTTLSEIPTTGNLKAVLRSILHERIQLIDKEQTSTKEVLMTLNEVIHNLQAIICSEGNYNNDEGNYNNELCAN